MKHRVIHAESVRYVRAIAGNPHGHDFGYMAGLARFYALEMGLTAAERIFSEAGYVFSIDPWRCMRQEEGVRP